MALRNYEIESALSLGATANGPWIPIDRQYNGFSIEAIVSAASSLNGTLKLQVTNIPQPGTADGADVTNSSVTLTGDGTTIWNVDRQHFKWVRYVWTRSAGTGALRTIFNENV